MLLEVRARMELLPALLAAEKLDSSMDAAMPQKIRLIGECFPAVRGITPERLNAFMLKSVLFESPLMGEPTVARLAP